MKTGAASARPFMQASTRTSGAACAVQDRAMRQELGVVGVGSVERVKALWRLHARKIQTETFFRAGVEDVVKNRYRFRKGLWDEDVKDPAAALTMALKRGKRLVRSGRRPGGSHQGFFVHGSFMDKTQDGTLPLDKSDSRAKKHTAPRPGSGSATRGALRLRCSTMPPRGSTHNW